MRQKCILLCGATLFRDIILQAILRQSYKLIIEQEDSQIEKVLKSHILDLVLLELDDDKAESINMIKFAKKYFPEIQFVVLNGSQNLIPQAFQNGATDAFRKPYSVELLVERISILIDRFGNSL